jgi:hypothetical protein
MITVQVPHERLELWKFLVAVLPATDTRSTVIHFFLGEGRGCSGGDSCCVKEKGWTPWVCHQEALLEQRLLLGS